MSDVAALPSGRVREESRRRRCAMHRVEQLLTDIRIELAKKPSTATLWGILATTVGIAAAMIGVFVGVLTYLQAFHLPH